VLRGALGGVSLDRLEHTNSECSCLTSSGLGLCNRVLALNDWQDGFLLDWRRVFETVSVDSAQGLLLQTHFVKFVNFKFPVRFESFFSIIDTFFLLLFSKNISSTRKIILVSLDFLRGFVFFLFNHDL